MAVSQDSRSWTMMFPRERGTWTLVLTSRHTTCWKYPNLPFLTGAFTTMVRLPSSELKRGAEEGLRVKVMRSVKTWRRTVRERGEW